MTFNECRHECIEMLNAKYFRPTLQTDYIVSTNLELTCDNSWPTFILKFLMLNIQPSSRYVYKDATLILLTAKYTIK